MKRFICAMPPLSKQSKARKKSVTFIHRATNGRFEAVGQHDLANNDDDLNMDDDIEPYWQELPDDVDDDEENGTFVKHADVVSCFKLR